MAISVNTTYPGKVNAPDANYDQGSIKNETVPDSSDDGTPLDEKWGNDFEGFKQAVMKSAGIAPTSPGNVPETILVSQMLQSIVELSSGRAFNYDDSGAADVYVFDVQTNQQAPQSLFDGMQANAIILVTNTGPSTVNVAGSGVKNIKTQLGSDPAAGDLTAGDYVKLVYDLANDYYVLSNRQNTQYMLVRDEKASGVDGGSTVTTAMPTAQTRVLNTVVHNTIAGASLATNQITLPAGVYRVSVTAPTHNNRNRCFLYNITDASVLSLGANANGSDGDPLVDNVMVNALLIDRITLAAQKIIEVRHYTDKVVATTGLGRNVIQGGNEIYTTIEITKEL